jgi:uncharacterized protein (DUF2147 family)
VTRASVLPLATLAVALFLSPTFAAEPYGTWARPSNGAQVVFYNCGGKLCGKVSDKGASSAKVGTVIVGCDSKRCRVGSVWTDLAGGFGWRAWS